MSEEVTQVEEHSRSTFGKETDEEKAGRDRWPSRAAFYLASVGSAVGFGNVWRFPALAKDYGGGAFFIPYLLALFLVGLPVLILEISLGQVHQTGNVGVFGSFHARFRGVGMASVACAYMLVVYYGMLLSWVTNAFFDSFGDGDPWAQGNATIAVDYFMDEIVGQGTLGDDLRPTRIVGANVGYSALVWLCVWGCLANGLLWTGRIAYFTMGLPILFLFIFLGKAASLEGANDGIKEYIGEWDTSVLRERPDVWSTAVSQIFFSLSVTFGTMTAYGSHCPRGEPAYANSIVIGLSNSLFSFISGFAVFSAMGHLAYLQGVAVDDVPYKGFSLVFGTWPVVFGTFKGGEHWVRLLFFNLFLLGIDSAFSILEGPITVTMDYFENSGRKVAKWKVSGLFSLSAFLLSLLYATDSGLVFLDTVDFYINFVLLLVGFYQTFGAGWVYGIEQQIEQLGLTIVLTYMVTNFASIIIACGLWFGLDDDAVWGGFVALFLCYFTGIGITLYLLRNKMASEPDKWTWPSILYELSFKNVMDLRSELESVCGYMSVIWALAIKQLIPHILLVLFINLARSENDDGDSLFGHYEGYETWPFQVLGILCVAFAAILFLIGWFFPDVFAGADLYAKKHQEMQTQDQEQMEEESIPEKALEKEESTEENETEEQGHPAEKPMEVEA